jgi:hypothetical protein
MNIPFHPEATHTAVHMIEEELAGSRRSRFTIFLGTRKDYYLTTGLSRGKMGEDIPY